MAEGLAAIGLAGNIIQFVSFSFVLISKTKELHQSTSGASSENVDLSLISQDIKFLSSAIALSRRTSGRLSDIADRCDAIAQELLTAIAQLQPKPHALQSGRPPTKWHSFRKALKCVWAKPDIVELKARLESLRDQVTMHLVSDTNDNQVQLVDLLKDWQKENRQAGYEITAQIQDLDVQLQAIHGRISHLHSDVFCKSLHDHFSLLTSNVHQVSQCHMIIASLGYECMRVRESAIKDAHEKTFAWIYGGDDPNLSRSRPGTGFSQWLQRDCGIYWVTGKPGSGKSTLMKYIYAHRETIRNLRVWCGDTQLVRGCFYFWLPGQQMQKSLEGLLQSLLHHILHACPEIAPTICPERWKVEPQSQYQWKVPPAPWTLSELQRSITLFREQATVTTKFYFQIDGLDEYYGDSWDVIETIRDLSTAPNVKLCLSSRPWNCFQKSFGQDNTTVLRIHDFTRPDIELFAREKLLASYNLCVDFERNDFEDLIRDIGERAQGVFLWVRLVVRSLRDGIINEDSISLLQERLHAIPSDLEEFFEQILGSVDKIYRSRMAGTFLAAMRSPRQLNLIHYYFLDRGDKTFGFHRPSKRWQDAYIQKHAAQTERSLNGRFKGLLEATSTVEISAQTLVDFLHRTLRDFLATKRMREKLQAWASQELNVLSAMSRAMIAESKFIKDYTHPSAFKLAIELASRGAAETGNMDDCYRVIEQADLESERVRPFHPKCGLNCYILRFAASLGHAEYLHYRMRSGDVALDFTCILKHAVVCPVNQEETYKFCLPSAVPGHGKSDQPLEWFIPSSSGAIGNVPLPYLVKILFDLGADPNAIVDDASSWTALIGQATRLMDGEQREQYWAVLEMFLEQGVDMSKGTDEWIKMLDRLDATKEDNLLNTLRYIKRLFSHGLDPNSALGDTTMTAVFLRTLTKSSLRLPPILQDIHHEILREFLRYGADVHVVYTDRTCYGWFERVCEELHPQREWQYALSSRLKQYRIFLEYGLDPNIKTHGDTTLWEGLLEGMHHGVQQGKKNIKFYQGVRDVMLISFQYGADPHVITIQRLLDNDPPFLSRHELDDIKEAMQREIDERNCQAQSRSRHQYQHSSSSEKPVSRSKHIPPPVSWLQKQQNRKRGPGKLSLDGQRPQYKRPRFS